MTREEAITILIREIDEDLFVRTEYREQIHEALNMAIEALKQEPCDDAISRQAALNCFTATKLKKFDFILYAREKIKNLPPVNPQPKTGHWIFDDECKEHGHCSECGYGSIDLVDGELHNFCRRCGAKMIEPQESEKV